jgi:hypothetical protein
VVILMPMKKPRGQELTLEEQRANQALNERRRIEHVNSRVKLCLFLAPLQRAEVGVSSHLLRLLKGDLPWGMTEPAKALPWVEQRTSRTLSPSQRDATRCRHALPARLARCALPLHPTPPRLLEVGRFAMAKRPRRAAGQPEPCTFLGVRPIGDRTRTGQDKLRRNPEKQRMCAKLQAITATLRWPGHPPIAAQGAWRSSVGRGS